MEKNNITLSDVERNKELFEYEMTEVILQLKGEFAKVSGKDLKLDEAQFEKPALDIPSDIPAVKIAPISLETSTTGASVPGETFTIPDITIQNTTIDCPAVPVPAMDMPDTVQVKKPELDCVIVEKMKGYSASTVELRLPSVSADIPDVSVADIPTIVPLTSKNQNVNAAIKIPQAILSAKIEKIQIDTPHLQSPISYNPNNVDIPEISINGFNTLEANASLDIACIQNGVDISPISISNVNIPEVKAYSPVSIEIKQDRSGSVHVPAKFEYSGHEAAISNADIHEPELPTISAYSEVAVTRKAQTVIPPGVPTIKMAAPTAVTIEPLEINTDGIYALSKTSLPTKGVNVNIEMPVVNFEHPTAAVPAMPTVSVAKLTEITVPEMPDFTSEIKEIIEAAV